MSKIIEEKLQQAHGILDELNVDAWMVFVRESSQGGESAVPLLHDGSFTWQTALIVTRSGERIAVVGKLDDGALRAAGVWSDVIPYVQSIRDPLVETMRRLDPRTLALDFSVDDYSSDGLTHGMYMLLHAILRGHSVRGSICECRMASSRHCADGSRRWRSHGCGLPSRSHRVFWRRWESLHGPARRNARSRSSYSRAVDRYGVEPAWHHPCPIVNTGPESMAGHGVPSDLNIAPGHLLHIDFGVKHDGYCSDLQRCWYVPRADEEAPPEPVRKAFETIVRAIGIAADAIKPGVAGCDVDAAARTTVVEAGYPEYGHALGHHVGHSAHDGGGIVGPAWPRYGKTPFRQLEVGNVLTLEPSIMEAGQSGCLGLEEMVLVTQDGCQWLSDRQTFLPCLGRKT